MPYLQELFAIEANIILLDEPAVRKSYQDYSNQAVTFITRAEKIVKAEIAKVEKLKANTHLTPFDEERYVKKFGASIIKRIGEQIGQDFSDTVDVKRKFDSQLAQAMN